MRVRRPFALVVLSGVVGTLLAVAGPARASGDLGITRDEYSLYMRYQEALAEEAIQQVEESKRPAAVARKLKTTTAALQAAIEKGESIGPSLADRLEQDIRGAIAATPLAGALDELKVQTGHAHIVVIIKWKNKADRKLEEEASHLAAAVHSGGHDMIGTLSLWAVSPAGRKVFEAKIGFEAMALIQADRVTMFAKKRYIKLFEDVWYLQPIRG